ncbi:MAG: DUF4395 domain-containing protein [Kineosporiaceae bacterium]
MSAVDAAAPAGIDPRGPRVAAAITSAVLVLALLTGSWVVLAAQALAFGLGVVLGVARSPYGWVFRRAVRPRLAPPAHLEDPAPPRFAQAVGLVVASAGLLGVALGGGSAAVAVASGVALVAAALNAVVGLCLGCELYVRLLRLRRR